MQLFIADTYQSMSAQCAGTIADIIKPVISPLVCVPSGDSPKALYKEWKLLLLERGGEKTEFKIEDPNYPLYFSKSCYHPKKKISQTKLFLY